MIRIIYILFSLCISLLFSLQIEAQTCSPNFTVKTEIKNATCLSNGEIKVILEGDTTNIFNIQYGLSSKDGFTINPQSDNVLRNLPPGTYELTVRAFCKIDEDYSVVKIIPSVVVGGNYKVPEISLNSDRSRKSYQACNTGIIALNVTNGNGNFTFTITSAPAGVETPQVITPVKNGNIYTFPGENYPAGDYTVEVSDECYTSVKDFTLQAISEIPAFSSVSYSSFRPDLDNTQGSCGYVRFTASSSLLSSNPDYNRYYVDRMYEIGAAPAGQVPTHWTEWNRTNTGGILLNISPYNVADFYTSNSLEVYVRVKGCEDTYTSYKTNIRKATGISSGSYVYNCDYFTRTLKPWNDYDGVLCYPLILTVKNNNTGETIYNNNNWLYNINNNDNLAFEYNVPYTITFTDQNGTQITSSMNVNARHSLSNSSNILDCDSYYFSYSVSSTGAPVSCTGWLAKVTITDPDGNIVQQSTIVDTRSIQTPKLEYDKKYTITIEYPDGTIQTQPREVTSALPTTYTLSTSSTYDDKCVRNKGRLRVSANKTWPKGTILTITGPAGYVTQSVTTSSSASSYTMSATILPPGLYTLTVDHGCGNPVVTTFNNPGIYDYQGLGYNSELTCSGMKITPMGNITYKGNPSTTYYRLTSGPAGYDKTVIAPGGSFTLSAPGAYKLGILTDNSSSACVLGDTTIIYTAPPLDLDPNATSAYICVDGTIGNISVKAVNGVAPFTYQLWNADNTEKIAGVSDITTSGIAHFTYGLSGETYTVRINDYCGNSFKQQVTISDLKTAKIVYASSSSICTGSTINLKCITLGNTSYSWTGPNGFTSNEQNPTISNAQTNMTGWYKVSVAPEFCGVDKLDSIYITVTPPLQPTPSTANQSIEICVREQIILSADVTGGDGFYTYQWQSSTDGESWSSIVGATNAIYSPTPQIKSGTYYYRRVTSDTTCGTTYNLITLNVKSCYILVNPNIRNKI